jgi:hypothetical protein
MTAAGIEHLPADGLPLAGPVRCVATEGEEGRSPINERIKERGRGTNGAGPALWCQGQPLRTVP